MIGQLRESDVPLTITLVQGLVTEIGDAEELRLSFEPLKAAVQLGQDRGEFNNTVSGRRSGRSALVLLRRHRAQSSAMPGSWASQHRSHSPPHCQPNWNWSAGLAADCKHRPIT
jgi:hypothetical protein